MIVPGSMAKHMFIDQPFSQKTTQHLQFLYIIIIYLFNVQKNKHTTLVYC